MSDNQAPESPLDPDALLKVGRLLFARYCQDEAVPRERRPMLNPNHFLKWLKGLGEVYTPRTLADAAALASTAEAHYWLTLAGTAHAPVSLAAIWPYLALEGRTRIHTLRSMALCLLLQWTDGTVVPMTVMAHAQLTDVPLRDAEVASILVTRTPEMTAAVVQTGLDGLHDGPSAQPAFIDTPLLERLLAVLDQAGLSEVDLARCQRLLRWVAGCLPGELDEAAIAKLLPPAVQAARAAKAPPPPPAAPRGGFAL